ncbi:unnamed protein product [Ceratitis capitata]|uniref:(Mediterranean fruit fly) hypothetical protein n=1 Tax=Ceratitis capitata TaxID=7213 RepID=A0A811UTT7_CERCA|nr:unnamed protein product [Ceratitis capitata]
MSLKLATILSIAFAGCFLLLQDCQAAALIPQPDITSRRIALLDTMLSQLRGNILDDFYHISNAKLNWYAANTFCKSQNWQLMAIEDIYNILNTRFWTAGNSLLTKGAWRWGVGEQATVFNFTNWGSAYPSDEDSNRKCVQLAPRTLDWEDESCSIQREFICQKSAIQ